MPVDERLSARFRKALAGLEGVSEKKMMGGLCFMLNGNMVGGAHREKDGRGLFMFRVGKGNTAGAEALGNGRVVELGGRVMSGLYFVDADDLTDPAFDDWKALAISHATSLPAKG